MHTTSSHHDRIATIINHVRAAYYPPPFLAILQAYLAGETALADLQAAESQLPNRPRNLITLLLKDTDGYDELDPVLLRIFDYCHAQPRGARYFIRSLTTATAFRQLYQTLSRRGTDLHTIVEILLDTAMVDNWHRLAARPTALGRFILEEMPASNTAPTAFWTALTIYIRDAASDWLRLRAQFVMLLLHAEPPWLDLAWEITQRIDDDRLGICAAALLRADPLRFCDFAREVATLPDEGDLREQLRYEPLEALMELDPARHVDLAVATVQNPAFGSYSRLRLMALTKAFRFDPQQYWALAEEVAQEDHNVGRQAILLLAEADFLRAVPILQRYVAEKESTYAQPVLRELLLAHEWPGRRAYALATLSHRAKALRDTAAAWLATQGSAVLPDLAQALKHRSADARLAAIEAIKRIGGEAAHAVLSAHLDGERSRKVRQAIVDVLGPQVAAGADLRETLAAEAAAMFQKIDWAAVEWIAAAGADLRWNDGDPVDATVFNYLLYCQSRARADQLDSRIAAALALLDAAGAGIFAQRLWQGWLESGATAEEAWVLPLAATLGDSELAAALRRHIDSLLRNKRRHMAVRLVKILAIQGSDLALAELDDLARHARKQSIRQAAEQALCEKAAWLGISQEELLDRAIPRLGFDAQGERIFDYGRRRFTVRLLANGALQVCDEAGKIRQRLPAPTPNDDPLLAPEAHGAGKALAVRLKQVRAHTIRRLEQAMIEQRNWCLPRWRELFVEHPLARRLIWSLVWCCDCGDGSPPLLFRPLEDGSLSDVDDEPLDLPADGQVTLAHPALLDAATVAAWQQHLADYELDPPFAQLNRPVARLDPALAAGNSWPASYGYRVLQRDLQAARAWPNWQLGYPQDHGMVFLIWRHFPAAGLDAIIPLLESLVPWDRYSGMMVLGELRFYPANPQRRGYAPGSDSSALPLDNIPPTVFSEAAADAQSFAGIGTRDPAWEVHR